MDILIKSSWETETFGCKYQHDVPLSPEYRRSQEILDAEVYHDGKRWVAPLQSEEIVTSHFHPVAGWRRRGR